MKRWIAGILCIVLLCANVSAASPAQMMDVAEDQWYYPAVAYCLSCGYMNGVSADAFRPGGTVSRAQLVQVLYNLSGRPDASSYLNPFADVKAEAWYTDAILWAKANGIVQGVSENHFAPDRPITREQVATMFYHYAELTGRVASDLQPEPVYLLPYEDAVRISLYALRPLQWAVQTGLMRGTSATALTPRGSCTRAQLAQLIRNYFEPLPVTRPAIPDSELTITPTYVSGRGDLIVGDFTVHLPASWAGACIAENQETDTTYGVSLYEKFSHASGYGGHLLTFMVFPEGLDYEYFPSYYRVGTFVHPGGWKEDLVAYFPTDVQFPPERAEQYGQMARDIQYIIDHLTFSPSAAFERNPITEVHPM